jgi:hypothetical protein
LCQLQGSLIDASNAVEHLHPNPKAGAIGRLVFYNLNQAGTGRKSLDMMDDKIFRIRIRRVQKTVYAHVFWISGASESDLIRGFKDIADLLDLMIPEKTPDPEKVRKAVLAWLNREKGWLLVFDNLDDIKLIPPYLPRINSGGHILITSRDPNE